MPSLRLVYSDIAIPVPVSKEVATNRLVRSIYNPLKRREKTDDLKQAIERDGQLEPVHAVVMEDGVLMLADGNRRAAALKELGVYKTKALVYEGGRPVLDKLFAALNGPKMTLKDDQMVQAALMGAPEITASVKKACDFLRSNFQPYEITELAKSNGVGSFAISTAKRIVEYTTNFKRNTPEFDKQAGVVLKWMVANQTQQKAIAYMRNGFSARILANAITANKPCPKMG